MANTVPDTIYPKECTPNTIRETATAKAKKLKKIIFIVIHLTCP